VQVGEWEDVPLAARVTAAGPFLATYMKNALFPLGLKAFYDLPFRTAPFDAVVISAWATVACALVATVLLWHRRQSTAAFGLAWFLASLLPVSGIVITLFPAFVADRYLYFPLVGMALAFGALVDGVAAALPPGRKRAAAGLAATAALLALASTTATRAEAWRDSLSLWSRAAEDAPGSAYVLNNYGTALRGAARLDEAEAVLLRAISIEDRTAGPHINLAGVAFARRDLATAERCVGRALSLEPGNPVAINFKGVVEANRGNFAEAQRCFEEAVRIWPAYPGALFNMRRLAHVAKVESGPVAALY
jgi:tetratricopeptide (TPR) repeat protein